ERGKYGIPLYSASFFPCPGFFFFLHCPAHAPPSHASRLFSPLFSLLRQGVGGVGVPRTNARLARSLHMRQCSFADVKWGKSDQCPSRLAGCPRKESGGVKKKIKRVRWRGTCGSK